MTIAPILFRAMRSSRQLFLVLLFSPFVQLEFSYGDESSRWEHPKYVYFVTRVTSVGGAWDDVNDYEVAARQFTPGINELHYTDGDVRLKEVSAPVLGPFYSKAELCAGCAHLPTNVLRRFGCLGTMPPKERKRDWR